MFVVLMLAATQPTLWSQVIVGRVIDAMSEEPLPYAVVEIALDEPVRLLTDDRGIFSIELRGATRRHVFIKVRRIGYEPIDRELAIDTARVAPMEIIALSRMPTEITGVTVMSSATRRLEGAGFYERAAAGFGEFITEETIRERRPRIVSEVLRSVPGVTVSPSRGRTGSNVITIMRGRARLRGVCGPKFIVDGRTIATPSDPNFDLDSYVRPEDVAGIEIYRGPSETPARFGGSESSCGVIVIWTK